MDLEDLFQEAVVNSKTLAQKPSNDTLLKLYAFYKQSTDGDVNVEPPVNPFDFVGKAKFGAWAELKAMPKEMAMKEYIDIIARLKG